MLGMTENWISGQTRNDKRGMHLIKIVAVLFMVCFSATNMFNIGSTVSYFNDSEESLNNTYQAGTLDFSTESIKEDGGLFSQSVTIINNGSLDFQYTVKIEKTGGDDVFCNALNIEALLENATYYSGNLLDFISLPMIYSASSDEWRFIILPPENPNIFGSCSFDFVFSGWQTNLSLSEGFSNIEKIDDPVYRTQEIIEEITKIEETGIEEPVVIEEEPIIAEDLPVVEELPLIEEPLIVEEPPVVIEDLPVIEKPLVVEEPLIIEEPEVIQEPSLNENQNVQENQESI
jgi:predicted ribosomally synthesized peptide with SipW-like signal peptide